jgi:2-methylcitrate dehydratase
MTEVERLAEFVARASYDDLSAEARAQLKIRVLDSLGCALGALDSPTVGHVRGYVDEFDGRGGCTLIAGGQASPDRATLYNGALVRYLDFNDSYLASGETCHPSDNVAPTLAAAEYAGCHGRDFLVALAVAYQVQCRLSDLAPVRAAGFDHTTQGSFAVAAAVSRALGLDAAHAAHALAISGTAFNALRVTRTGQLSNWKGLAYPNTAACCTQATLLARNGITGPLEVFEGNKGFMDAIAGQFSIDWLREDLERVTHTILKRHNAEVHSQTAIEAVLHLRASHRVEPGDVQAVDIEIFDVAYQIIGGGQEGDKTLVCTKEDADHSLPYLVAVALIDGRVMPPQYAESRIQQADVQHLLCHVTVRPSTRYSARFPKAMPCQVTITLRDGRRFAREVDSYPGFLDQPMSWDMVRDKFDALAAPFTSAAERRTIVDAVAALDSIPVRELTHNLAALRYHAREPIA